MFLQAISALDGRPSPAKGCKTGDCSSMLQENLRQICPTDAAIYSGQHVFVESRTAQLTVSARIANEPLTNIMPKTLSPFKTISTTPDIVTVDENGIHNTVFIGRVTFAPYNAQGHDGAD